MIDVVNRFGPSKPIPQTRNGPSGMTWLIRLFVPIWPLLTALVGGSKCPIRSFIGSTRPWKTNFSVPLSQKGSHSTLIIAVMVTNDLPFNKKSSCQLQQRSFHRMLYLRLFGVIIHLLIYGLTVWVHPCLWDTSPSIRRHLWTYRTGGTMWCRDLL